MRLFSRKTRRKARKASTFYRPQLELLEDRSLLAAGALDTTFGTNGLVATDFAGRRDNANDLVIQPNGMIVVAGHTQGNSMDFAVVRYTANGSLDTSFAQGGIAVTDFGGSDDSAADALALQTDGKIVAVGFTDGSSSFALARYNENGSLDTSFGDGGMVTTSFSGFRNVLGDVAIQSDGKIVVVGDTTSFGGGDDYILARYNANGSLDATFDNDGIVVTNFGGVDLASSLAIQSDGKIIAVGGVRGGIGLARYNTNGSLDTLFGSAGMVITSNEGNAHGVVLEPGGRIAVSSTVDGQLAVARYLVDGSLDPSFGSGGVAMSGFRGESPSLALQADGKFVVTGTRLFHDGTRRTDDFVLTRFNGLDGSLDLSFGNGGSVIADFAPAFGRPFSREGLDAVALQSDGKIAVAGFTNVNGTDDIALARFLVDDGDDPVPSISISNAVAREGSAPFQAAFTVTLSAPSDVPASVDYATANGSALAGSDYAAISGTLVFAPGETSQTVLVDILDNEIHEGNETFTLNLSNPVGVTIADGQGLATIVDNEPAPALAVNDTTVTEGIGFPKAAFTVTLSAPSEAQVRVAYITGNVNALAGSDYASTFGTLIFAPGETSKTVLVDILDDSLHEANETFTFNLSSPVGATINDSQGLATIVDDDPAVTIAISDASASEGSGPSASAVFTVTLGSSAATLVRVNYTTVNGVALAGSDFAFRSGLITFAPGETTKTISVPLIDNAVFEETETFTVNLSSPSGALIVDGQGLGTIIDNDPQSTNDPTSTKFYVVDTASVSTYEYAAGGASIENYSLKEGNTSPRGAASTAAGAMVWVIDKNRRVYRYDASGNLQGSWTAEGLPETTQLEGIATNGNDVWLVDAKSDKVYRYLGAAHRTLGSQAANGSFNLSSNNANPKDIVTNGTYLWVVDDALTDRVFKYTIGGFLLGSWSIGSANSRPTGITIDPAIVSDIWIVDRVAQRVFQYTAAASRLSGSQSPAASFALAAGNTNPQGIADPPTPAAASAATAVSKPSPEATDIALGQLLMAEATSRFGRRASGFESPGRLALSNREFKGASDESSLAARAYFAATDRGLTSLRTIATKDLDHVEETSDRPNSTEQYFAQTWLADLVNQLGKLATTPDF